MKSGHTVDNTPVVAFVILAMVLWGCAEVPIRTPTRHQDQPSMPLSVGVILLESIENHIDTKFVLCLPLKFDLPLGRELKEATARSLDHVFGRVEVIRNQQEGVGRFDLLIEPKLPIVRVDGHCATATGLAGLTYGVSALFIKKYVEALVDFEVRVSDRSGQQLVSHVYRSARHPRQFEVLEDARRYVGEAVGEALSEVLDDMTVDLAKAEAIRAYAQALTPTIQMPARETVASLGGTSDVDMPFAGRANVVPSKHALIIGIERYRTSLPKASFADHDAAVMKEYVTGLMGYSEENVALLINDRATKSDLEKDVEGWLPTRVKKDDSVFVYFSGHGAPHVKDREAYLVPYDGDPVFLDKTGYALKRLYEQLGKLPAKEIVVVLDACFSGAGDRSILAPGMRPVVLSVENPILAGNHIVVLAASAGDQFSSTYFSRKHGLMTYFILKGLRGEADLNHDGVIGLTEVFHYSKPKVESVARLEFNTEQTPQLLGSPEIIARDVRLRELAGVH